MQALQIRKVIEPTTLLSFFNQLSISVNSPYQIRLVSLFPPSTPLFPVICTHSPNLIQTILQIFDQSNPFR